MLQKLVFVTAFLAASTVIRADASLPKSDPLSPLIDTIIAAESSGRPWVTGDNGRARGLMQIQRPTWERYTSEPWSRAYDPRLNRAVGTRIVRDIERRYGARATPALIVYTYNTGRFIPAGKPVPAWTKKHPNRIYRKVFTA